VKPGVNCLSFYELFCFVSGRLDQDEKTEITDHLLKCETCAKENDLLQKLYDQMSACQKADIEQLQHTSIADLPDEFLLEYYQKHTAQWGTLTIEEEAELKTIETPKTNSEQE
jgi:hypothetical protein